MTTDQAGPSQSLSAPRNRVRRRHVFYIPGYDPIHPRRYRELYRREGAQQAAISGFEISLSPKSGQGPYGWHVASQMEGAKVAVDFDVLVWSDIVRDSMSHTIAATYLQLFRTAWAYIGPGVLWRLMQLRKGPVIAALYPVGFLLLQACLAFLAGGAVFSMLQLLLAPLIGFFGYIAALVAGLIMVWAILRWFQRNDGKFFAYYLMHDFAYSAQFNGANQPELEQRMAKFRSMIADALTTDVDEVLVVGHSSGAHVGVSVLADLIRAGQVPANGPALGFLSLGQVVPMVSFLPEADRLRGDLQYLSAREELAWVDVTAPGDGCAFALCDPVTVSGVAPTNKKWPLVFSAAFTQTLSPARWKELRWRFFRLHFQYLCAFDRPNDYDYFRVTAGPQTLGARYQGRLPSRSRIDRAVSKFTSVASP